MGPGNEIKLIKYTPHTNTRTHSNTQNLFDLNILLSNEKIFIYIINASGILWYAFMKKIVPEND